MTQQEQAYIEGFVKRAAEYGFNESEAINFLKQAAEGTMTPNELPPYPNFGAAVQNAPYTSPSRPSGSPYGSGGTVYQPFKKQMPVFNPGATNTLSGRYDREPASVIAERLPGSEMYGKPLKPTEARFNQSLPKVLTNQTTMDQVKATPGMMNHVVGSPENAKYLEQAARQQGEQRFPGKISLQ